MWKFLLLRFQEKNISKEVLPVTSLSNVREQWNLEVHSFFINFHALCFYALETSKSMLTALFYGNNRCGCIDS
jgi:hypothetical protein